MRSRAATLPFWLAPTVILLAALLLRAAGLAYPLLDSDMAIVGLMARQALRGEFPIFFYGEPVGGSIESFLAAPLMALFGSSPLTLSLAPALVSLVFVWVAYLVCRDMWGRPAGLAAMTLAALPPAYLAWLCVAPRGAYIEIPLFSLLALWLTYRIVHRGAGSWACFLYGLVCGVGMWTHFLMVYALAASGLYLLLADWRVLLRRAFPLMLAGFFLGSLPLWIYNLANDWQSLTMLLNGKVKSPAWQVLTDLFRIGFPSLLGVFRDGETRAVLPGLSHLVAGLWGLGLLYLLWSRRRALAGLALGRAQRADGSELFLLMLTMVVLVTTLKGEALGMTRRHLAPVFAAVIPLGAYLLAKVHARWRGLALALGGIVLASNLAGVWQAFPLFDAGEREQARDAMRERLAITQAMAEAGATRAYAPDFWVGPLLTFYAQERVLAVRPQISLDMFYEPHLLAVGQAPQVAWLCWRETPGVERMLKAMGASYKTLRGGPYFCFHDIKAPPRGTMRVPSRLWRAQASQHGEDAGLAFDGDALTRWSPLAPQVPGQSFELDLGQVEPGLCMVRLASGRDDDEPASLSLELSLDGLNYERVAKMGMIAYPLYWDAGRAQTGPGRPRLDISFAPRAARYLRLTQTGASAESYWSLQELAVFRAAPVQEKPSARQAVDLAQTLGARRIYADYHPASFVPADLRPLKFPVPRAKDWPMDLEPEDVLPRDLTGLAVLVETAHAEQTAAFLENRRIRFSRQDAGGYALFTGLDDWGGRLAALSPAKVEAALSSPEQGGDASTGQALLLEMERVEEVAGLALECSPRQAGQLAQATLSLSSDGRQWSQVEFSLAGAGPLIFMGDHLASAKPGSLRLYFHPRQARLARLDLPASLDPAPRGFAFLAAPSPN